MKTKEEIENLKTEAANFTDKCLSILEKGPIPKVSLTEIAKSNSLKDMEIMSGYSPKMIEHYRVIEETVNFVVYLPVCIAEFIKNFKHNISFDMYISEHSEGYYEEEYKPFKHKVITLNIINEFELYGLDRNEGYSRSNKIFNVLKILSRQCSNAYNSNKDTNFKNEEVLEALETLLILLNFHEYNDTYFYFDTDDGLGYFERIVYVTTYPYHCFGAPHPKEVFLSNLAHDFGIGFNSVNGRCFIPTHLDPNIFKEKWENIIENIDTLMTLEQDELYTHQLIMDLVEYYESDPPDQWEPLILKDIELW